MSHTKHIAAATLILLTCVAYFPVIQHGGFIWDDDDYVQNNATLRTADGLRRIWLEPGATPQYYPLTFSSFWIEYQAWKLAPRGYHLVNVLLHGANAVLLWLVLARLKVPGAWLAAAVFALHPVHVESVAWITERKNVLSGFFYLAALLSYLQFDPLTPQAGREERNAQWYFAALGLFTAALLCKTVTCSLPAALLLIIWWKRGRIGLKDIVPLVPMFVLGLTLAAVTVWMERQFVGAKGQDWQLTWVERCLIAGRAVWFYAETLVWPTNLTFIYPRWTIDATDWRQYLYVVAAIAVFATLWLARRRIGRGPLVAVLFFVGTLMPALGFFDVYPMRYSFVADHFQYLANIGLIVLVVGPVATAARNASLNVERASLAAAAGIVLVLATLTFDQSRIYEGLVPLWTDTLRKNPGCWMAHYNLGKLRAASDGLDEAEKHLNAAIALKPNLVEAHSELGSLCVVQNRHDDAMRHFHDALHWNPRHEPTLNNMGMTQAAQGLQIDSMRTFTRLLEINPRHANAHFQLGRKKLEERKPDQAIEHLTIATKTDPTFFEAYQVLGQLYIQQGMVVNAINALEHSVRLRPNDPSTRQLLGQALQLAGRHDEARTQFINAQRLGGS